MMMTTKSEAMLETNNVDPTKTTTLIIKTIQGATKRVKVSGDDTVETVLQLAGAWSLKSLLILPGQGALTPGVAFKNMDKVQDGCILHLSNK